MRILTTLFLAVGLTASAVAAYRAKSAKQNKPAASAKAYDCCIPPPCPPECPRFP